MERKVRVEFGEKLGVVKGIVSFGSRGFEGAASQVGEEVVEAGNVENRQGRGQVGEHAEGQGSGELLADSGTGAAHADSP